MQSCVLEVFYFPGRAAEQGEPYGPAVEQLSLEKEQPGAPTIWANYKTCGFSLCVLRELSRQPPRGSMMERDGIPCMLLPGQLHSTLDTLAYLLGLSELISEVTSSKCPSSFSPQPLPSGGSLPLPLENINVIPLAQPPLASLAGCGVYLKSA